MTHERFDSLIIGGGIVGAATAEELTRRGRRVLLLDQFHPGHDRGSSHGDGRIIRLSYPEAVYLEMAQRVYPAWRRLEQDGGETLIELSGSWECGPEDSPLLADLERGFASIGVSYERLDAAESARRFPHFHLPEGSAAIFQPDGGIARAERAVRLLWRLAESGGATLRPETAVTAIEPHPNGIEVLATSGERFVGDRVVLAAGGFSPSLLRPLGLDLPLIVSEEFVAYFAPSGDLDHRVGHMPTLIDYHGEHPFYALPQIDVPGVKIGWHRTGPEIDPNVRTAQDPVRDRIRQRLRRYVTERFTSLSDTGIHETTCLYTNTPDYHFILDHHPDDPRIIIAAGFSGHGFKFGPVLGECLACLVVGEAPPIDLHTFRLERLLNQDIPLHRRTSA